MVGPGVAPGVLSVDDSEDKGRVSLSRDSIALAALELTADNPLATLTLGRLGAELGADPTAIYRHYRNRDELILDLGDRMLGAVLDDTELTGSWRERLAALAHGTRRELLRRPALAAETAVRFTGGVNERRFLLLSQQILRDAEFPADEALHHAWAFGAAILGHVAMTAASASQSAEAVESDRAVAVRLFGPTVTDGDDDSDRAVFDRIVDVYLTGLELIAGDALQPLQRNHSDQGGTR